MKIANKICQILAVLSGVGAVALFFLGDFATIVGSQTTTLTGAQLAFGGSAGLADTSVRMAQSAHIWLCVIISIIGAVFSALTFKFKSMRYAAPAASLISAVYMLVIALGNEFKFVDYRTYPEVGKLGKVLDIDYGSAVLLITALLFVATAFGIAHLLVSDRIAVAGTKKLTIPRRIVAFFRDYKSETKKIAWPNFKFVTKNTFIVLVICAIIGAFIWVLDWGLANVLKLLLGA